MQIVFNFVFVFYSFWKVMKDVIWLFSKYFSPFVVNQMPILDASTAKREKNAFESKSMNPVFSTDALVTTSFSYPSIIVNF